MTAPWNTNVVLHIGYITVPKPLTAHISALKRAIQESERQRFILEMTNRKLKGPSGLLLGPNPGALVTRLSVNLGLP